MIDPYAKHRALDIQEHIEDYEQSMIAAACAPKHICDTVNVLRRVCAYCDFHRTEDFDVAVFNTYLASILKRKKGNSYRTRNRQLDAMKWICNWHRKNDRLKRHPFTTIERLNEAACPHKRVRRAITADELTSLVDAAQNGPKIQ